MHPQKGDVYEGRTRENMGNRVLVLRVFGRFARVEHETDLRQRVISRLSLNVHYRLAADGEYVGGGTAAHHDNNRRVLRFLADTCFRE
jgi:hypothetical protein